MEDSVGSEVVLLSAERLLVQSPFSVVYLQVSQCNMSNTLYLLIKQQKWE